MSGISALSSSSWSAAALPSYFPSAGSSAIPGYVPPASSAPPLVTSAASLVSALLPNDPLSSLASQWSQLPGIYSSGLSSLPSLPAGSGPQSFSEELTSEFQSDPALMVSANQLMNSSWLLQNSVSSYQSSMSLSSLTSLIGSNLNTYA